MLNKSDDSNVNSCDEFTCVSVPFSNAHFHLCFHARFDFIVLTFPDV